MRIFFSFRDGAIALSVIAMLSFIAYAFLSPIPFGWPLLQIVVWATFVSCVVAIAASSLHLRQERAVD